MAGILGNKFALGNKGGRPPVFKTPKELENKCSDYFHNCSVQVEKATITGLALYLGFSSRQSLYDYEEKKEFTYTIKRAKLTVEHSYELSGNTIDIFALKQMGWKDATKTEITATVKTTTKEIRVNTPEEKKAIDAWLKTL